MKKIFTLLLLLISATSFSQNRIISYINRLEQPATNGTRAAVKLDQDSYNVLSKVHSSGQIDVHRICIAIESGQNGRERANAALSLLNAKFPRMSSYTKFNSPNYTVYAGDFITKMEANMMLSLMKPIFPKSIIVTELVPIRILTNQSTIQIDATNFGAESD